MSSRCSYCCWLPHTSMLRLPWLRPRPRDRLMVVIDSSTAGSQCCCHAKDMVESSTIGSQCHHRAEDHADHYVAVATQHRRHAEDLAAVAAVNQRRCRAEDLVHPSEATARQRHRTSRIWLHQQATRAATVPRTWQSLPQLVASAAAMPRI
jgi:hypothetical protein